MTIRVNRRRGEEGREQARKGRVALSRLGYAVHDHLENLSAALKESDEPASSESETGRRRGGLRVWA